MRATYTLAAIALSLGLAGTAQAAPIGYNTLVTYTQTFASVTDPADLYTFRGRLTLRTHLFQSQGLDIHYEKSAPYFSDDSGTFVQDVTGRATDSVLLGFSFTVTFLDGQTFGGTSQDFQGSYATNGLYRASLDLNAAPGQLPTGQVYFQYARGDGELDFTVNLTGSNFSGDTAIEGIGIRLPPGYDGDPEVCYQTGQCAFAGVVTSVVPVPEPATTGLLGAGVLGLLAVRRGRRPRPALQDQDSKTLS